MGTALVAGALWIALSPGAVGGHDEAARLLVLVNSARADAQRAPLRRDPRLDEVALTNTRRMVADHRLRHSDARVLRQLRAVAFAENVGAASDAEALHRLMLASPRHRANLLGPYVAVGIAAARGRDGLLYATFVFASWAKDSGQWPVVGDRAKVRSAARTRSSASALARARRARRGPARPGCR